MFQQCYLRPSLKEYVTGQTIRSINYCVRNYNVSYTMCFVRKLL